MHVKTGQTPKERLAVIKATTVQGTGCQDSSLISQVLSKPPEITNLNEACGICGQVVISYNESSVTVTGPAWYLLLDVFKLQQENNKCFT